MQKTEDIIVPEGVAVEKLDGGKKKLADQCPPRLRQLLQRKQLMPIYDQLVQTIVQESKTRSVFGNWRDMEFVQILYRFREDFADKGVNVVLCKRKLGSGASIRWLEFIDVDLLAGKYVPQHDVSNLSGQVIKTAYSKLEFPYGVAVEEIRRYGLANKRLKEKMPVLVEELMAEKGLMKEYDALVDDFIAADIDVLTKWNTEDVEAVVRAHAPKFEAKGVSVFFNHKREYISHGKYGHYEYFRWLEFVDRQGQPNYRPQREDMKQHQYCVIF